VFPFGKPVKGVSNDGKAFLIPLELLIPVSIKLK